jgi:hypothetical protein
MTNLDTPDLCARLDSLKRLCDRLEAAQDNPERYHDLVRKIRVETEMFQQEVCAYLPKETPSATPVMAAVD